MSDTDQTQYGVFDDSDDLVEDGFKGEYGRVAAGAAAADLATDGRTFTVREIPEQTARRCGCAKPGVSGGANCTGSLANICPCMCHYARTQFIR